MSAGWVKPSDQARRAFAWTIASMLVLGAVLAPKGFAAKILDAPSAYVDQQQNVVARLVVKAKVGDHRVTFRRVESLLGDAKRRETIRLGEEAYAAVEEGATYVVAFTRLRRPPRTHGVYEPDPAGPRLLQAPAVGPVVLVDNEAMRRLVLRPKASALAADRLDAVLRALEEDDPFSTRFAAAELVFRDDLRAAVGEKQLPRLVMAIGRARVDPQLQDLLLRAAGPLAALEGGGWLVAASKRVLDGHSTEIDFTSFVPALLQSAARALALAGEPTDVTSLAVHLRSRHPGVAKVALEAFDTLDAAGAKRAATEALSAPELPAENRRVLERYLRGAPAGT